MAEEDKIILRLLREIRAAQTAMDAKVEAINAKLDATAAKLDKLTVEVIDVKGRPRKVRREWRPLPEFSAASSIF